MSQYHVVKDDKFFAIDWWGRHRFQETERTNSTNQWSTHPTTAMTFYTYAAARNVADEYGGQPIRIAHND